MEGIGHESGSKQAGYFRVFQSSAEMRTDS
jgi:hypothetical protein